MKHLGDITKIDGTKTEPVWCITGGSPCQDLSVAAGKRKGLAGERSGLFMEQIRIIKEMREHDRANGRTGEFIRPRYSVWENVPGAFSSNNGYDFLAVLEEFVHIAEPEAYVPRPAEVKGKLRWEKSGVIAGNGHSLAWRLHDVQYFGVPQRRRRICVLVDYGGQTAPDILMEYIGSTKSSDREQTVMDIGRCRPQVQSQSVGLSGHTAKSRQEGQSLAGDVEKGSGTESEGIEYF